MDVWKRWGEVGRGNEWRRTCCMPTPMRTEAIQGWDGARYVPTVQRTTMAKTYRESMNHERLNQPSFLSCSPADEDRGNPGMGWREVCPDGAKDNNGQNIQGIHEP
eukprot:TRINITY_DN2348_c0_g2_i5.p4 TRINITY_DN2348_c0_g2~~TRINITY_DN2348_c0_g2_i5.p4  ORF type:complete len:106 (+),score=3.69 TRINITY_DN2348_c0_g2_i5:180-497(+)